MRPDRSVPPAGLALGPPPRRPRCRQQRGRVAGAVVAASAGDTPVVTVPLQIPTLDDRFSAPPGAPRRPRLRPPRRPRPTGAPARHRARAATRAALRPVRSTTSSPATSAPRPGRAQAIAQCESHLNPNAVSPTNDHGLFQINIVHRGQFESVTGAPGRRSTTPSSTPSTPSGSTTSRAGARGPAAARSEPPRPDRDVVRPCVPWPTDDSPPARPGRCTSATCAPHCWPGCSPGSTAAGSWSGSRTSTRWPAATDLVDEHLADLAALGLDHDGPVIRQSDPAVRARHEAALDALDADGLLYPCFCTRREVAEAASAAHGPLPEGAYPGTCRDLTAGERRRRAADRPDRQPALAGAGRRGVEVTVVDRLHGAVTRRRRRLRGPARRRRAGVQPRGGGRRRRPGHRRGRPGRRPPRRHPSPGVVGPARSASRYPAYAHVPLVLGPDGERLAKRHGAVTRRRARPTDGIGAERLLGMLGCVARAGAPGEAVTADAILARFDPDAVLDGTVDLRPDLGPRLTVRGCGRRPPRGRRR